MDFYPVILGTQVSILDIFRAATTAIGRVRRGVPGPQQVALASKLYNSSQSLLISENSGGSTAPIRGQTDTHGSSRPTAFWVEPIGAGPARDCIFEQSRARFACSTSPDRLASCRD